MTRQDMTDYIIDELGEFEGSEMFRSPNALQRMITATCDELAALSKGVYQVFRDDLTTGVAVYCASPLIKIVGASVHDAAGNSVALGFITARDLVQTTGARASVPAAGTPRLYASQGANSIELYPVPDYTTTGAAGLTVEGYGIPGASWAGMSSECPLPAAWHMGVVYGALVKRCNQFPRALGDRLDGYSREWSTYKGRAESQVAVQTSADRRRGREYGGAAAFSPADPLNNGFTGLGA